jgi:hypothetical protein
VRISPNIGDIKQEKLIIAIFGYVGKASHFTNATLQFVISTLHVESIEWLESELEGEVLDDLVMVRRA